jgi:Mrp family chromosome partitioning ATPase
MSRINEAFQRSEGAVPANLPGAVMARDGRWPNAMEHPLKQYASELKHRVTTSAPIDIEGSRPSTAATRVAVACPRAREAHHVNGPGLVTGEGGSDTDCQRILGLLERAHVNPGVRTVMVTSTTAGEARTAVALELAASLARSYPRVLVMDADLQQPSLHEAFGVANDVGLETCVDRGSDPLPLIGVGPQMWALPAGPGSADSFAVLASDRMAGILHECDSRFDWVVIIGPPVLGLADPTLLRRRADAIAFVIGRTTLFARASQAMARLGRASIIGTILGTPTPRPSIPSTDVTRCSR